MRIKIIALYYHILDIKSLEKHKYTRFRVLLATTKFRQKFYRTALFFELIFRLYTRLRTICEIDWITFTSIVQKIAA
jgi:hypothetical protein